MNVFSAHRVFYFAQILSFSLESTIFAVISIQSNVPQNAVYPSSFFIFFTMANFRSCFLNFAQTLKPFVLEFFILSFYLRNACLTAVEMLSQFVFFQRKTWVGM